MEKFTSEVLPSGLKVEGGNGNNFTLSFGDTKLFLSRLDIARMYGIANPEKRHGSCNVDPERERHEKLMKRMQEYGQDPVRVFTLEVTSKVMAVAGWPHTYPPDIAKTVIPKNYTDMVLGIIKKSYEDYCLQHSPEIVNSNKDETP